MPGAREFAGFQLFKGGRHERNRRRPGWMEDVSILPGSPARRARRYPERRPARRIQARRSGGFRRLPGTARRARRLRGAGIHAAASATHTHARSAPRPTLDATVAPASTRRRAARVSVNRPQATAPPATHPMRAIE
ncbi:hypothetical protein Bpla01_30970 [Burkholderia plantarii]|nr:hypothetical protein Bpla01_30970 [Burkholderia plantarii]